jgi:hypothetical protein
MAPHLREGLGMKCFHLRWVPHALTDNQKTKMARRAQAMIKALDNH